MSNAALKIVKAFAILALTVGVFHMAAAKHHSATDVTIDFLNVGQGDSELITTPGGYQILIDGGPDQSVLSELRSVLASDDRHLDLIMLTHPDADHITGLVDVLRDYDVDTVMMPAATKDTGVYKAFVAGVRKEQARIMVVEDNLTLHLPDDLKLETLSPNADTFHEGEPANSASIVARFTFGQRTFLFTGDIEQDIEGRMLATEPTALDADLLKAPHHGSITSSTIPLLEAVSPAVVVIEVGQNNKFHHPSPVVLDRYQRQHIQVFRTDQLGRIEMTSDGRTIRRVLPCNPLRSLFFSCPGETVYNGG